MPLTGAGRSAIVGDMHERRQTANEGSRTKDGGHLFANVRSSLVAGLSSLKPRFWAGLALIAFFAALYLATLDNGLSPGELLGGDLITHQYAQVQGRFSNAPGYPLYTMGGWLWFHLGRALFGPDANPIAILSGYSALWALLSLGLLYALILLVTDRGDGGNWPVALLTTAFYGVTYFFWYYAVTTEQYASSVAWTLAVIWLAFLWERTRRDNTLLAMAFLGGVALAHQLTLPIVLLPLLWFVLSGQPGLLRRPKLIAAAIGLVLLPLASYAYVYAAGASHPEWRGAGQWANTWEWFWGFVSTSQGRAELTWSWTPLLTAEFPALIWRELTVPGLIAGLLGWAVLGRRRAIVLYASFALYLAMCWIDRLGNWYQVIMPMYGLLALGIGAGADWLELRPGEREKGSWGEGGRGSSNRHSSRSRARARALVLFCLFGLLCYRAVISYPLANSRDRAADTGLAPGWAALADDPPVGTAVFGTAAEEAALNYLTQLWGQRPDLRTVTGDQARVALTQGVPLAVTRAVLPLAPQEIGPEARYGALGQTLIALYREPARTVLSGLQPWTHDFGPALQLLGGRTERNPATGEMVVRLAWEAKEKPDQDWSVSVRLTQDGREIAQVDQQHPVFGAYPTSRWSPGEVVSDAYPVTLPPGAKADGVTVILYRKATEGGFVNLEAASFPLSR
jgi:hypothetical protein